jgi:hypothetical protein
MSSIKKNIYDILKGNFLINKNALKNWRFLVFIVMLMLLMISSAHYADRQVLEIAKLNKEIKELKAEFVDTRSVAMKIKLESNIKNKVKDLGLEPSENPPEIIKVTSKPIK